MVGRYGYDRLSRDVLFLGLGFWVLSLFAFRYVFVALYDVCLLYSVWRALSRNIYKRQKELAAYLRLMEKPERFFRLQKQKHADRKTHKYFACACGKTLRVPRGKGKIKIRCAACGKEMIKRT